MDCVVITTTITIIKVEILYPNDDNNTCESNSDDNSENNSDDRPLTNA